MAFTSPWEGFLKYKRAILGDLARLNGGRRLWLLWMSK